MIEGTKKFSTFLKVENFSRSEDQRPRRSSICAAIARGPRRPIPEKVFSTFFNFFKSFEKVEKTFSWRRGSPRSGAAGAHARRRLPKGSVLRTVRVDDRISLKKKFKFAVPDKLPDIREKSIFGRYLYSSGPRSLVYQKMTQKIFGRYLYSFGPRSLVYQIFK